MIFDIAFTMIENVNNDIQISVAQGCSPGQRIITETMEEKPKDKNGQDLFTVHPTKPWLINSSDNYILMQGELKVWFRWKDGDPFSKENVDDYIAFQETLRPNFRSDVDLVLVMIMCKEHTTTFQQQPQILLKQHMILGDLTHQRAESKLCQPTQFLYVLCNTK